MPRDKGINRRDKPFVIVGEDDFAIAAALKDPGAMLVYTYLRWRTGPHEGCWPAIKEISEGTGIGRRTVQAKIDILTRARLIDVEERTRDNGSTTSHLYTIRPLSRGGANSAPPCANSAHPGGANSAQAPRANSAPPELDSLNDLDSVELDSSSAADAASAEQSTFDTAPPSPAEDREVAPRKARPRDPIWDTLADVCGHPASDVERGDFAKSVVALKQAEAVPDEIHQFAAWWLRTHPEAALTHRCYRFHMGRFRLAAQHGPVLDTKNPILKALIVNELEQQRDRAQHLQPQDGGSGGDYEAPAGNGHRRQLGDGSLLPEHPRSR